LLELYKTGGIYLDADMEVLPWKNFDDLLNEKMFCCKEDNGFIANSAIGSIRDHPLLGDCLNTMEQNFKGNDGKVFEAGMEIFTDNVVKAPKKWGIKILTPDYFCPYNHQTGVTNKTKNTRTYHHFMKSWKK
jgi:mannosyltransferase OCH1-like enzyme